MVVGIEPGQDGSPAGRAERSGDVGIFKMDAFGREAIKMGRLEERVSEKAHRVVAMIISENDEDVWAGEAALKQQENESKDPQVHAGQPARK